MAHKPNNLAILDIVKTISQIPPWRALQSARHSQSSDWREERKGGKSTGEDEEGEGSMGGNWDAFAAGLL